MVFAQHLFNGLINEENVKINNINEGDLHLEDETPVHDNAIDNAGINLIHFSLISMIFNINH